MSKKYKAIIDEINRLKKNIDNEELEYFFLTKREIRKIAEKFHYPVKKVEIIALSEGIMPLRYQKNYNIINFSDQIKLLCSRVAVIGCGGLGGNVLELLARLGIGELITVDGDKFIESNLNRQIFCTENNLGKSKVKVAIERIKSINSSLEVKSYPLYIDSINVQEIIQEADVVVDALDNIPSRFILESACQRLDIPLIHGAVDGFNGQISTIFPQHKGLELIYGLSRDLNRQERKKRLSVPAVTPALIASFQVQEVIKILLQKGKPLRNKLLFINLEDYDIEILKLDK